MGKKSKKGNDKNKNKNLKNNKTNIKKDNRFFENYSEKLLIKFQNRKDKKVWSKISFWIIIFPPYALYLFFKKTDTSKLIKGLVLFLLVFVLVLIYDISKYPNRVYNSVAMKTYESFRLENEELNINQGLIVDKRNSFKYEDNLYFGFNIYDSINMYYGIFKINDLNKDYDLKYLYKLDLNDELLYCDKEFKKFKDVNPIVLSYMLSDESYDYGNEIKEVKTIEHSNLFEDSKTQLIKTDTGKFTFIFNDFNIEKILNTNNTELYSVDKDSSYVTPFKTVYNLLYKNFKDKYSIVGYNYLPQKHCFNISVGEKRYTVEYEFGVGATLKSIENYNEYLDSINDMSKLLR